jgi:hypothetical protein
MIVFEDKELQARFEKAKDMHEAFRQVINTKVDFNNPIEVLNQLGALNNIAGTGVEAEAMFEYLNDKHAMKKLSLMDMDSRGAMEKKIIISAELGSTSFWLTLIRLLIKESHYSSDRLRSALSYLKQEARSL